jgi:hypothetical protein
MPSRKSLSQEPKIALAAQNVIPAFSLTEDVIEEQIRQRAFRLYEERGREDGHAEEDWLQAELEISSRQAGKAA